MWALAEVYSRYISLYCVPEIVYSQLCHYARMFIQCCLRVKNGHRILPVFVLLVHATKLWFLLSLRQLRDSVSQGGVALPLLVVVARVVCFALAPRRVGLRRLWLLAASRAETA